MLRLLIVLFVVILLVVLLAALLHSGADFVAHEDAAAEGEDDGGEDAE